MGGSKIDFRCKKISIFLIFSKNFDFFSFLAKNGFFFDFGVKNRFFFSILGSKIDFRSMKNKEKRSQIRKKKRVKVVRKPHSRIKFYIEKKVFYFFDFSQLFSKKIDFTITRVGWLGAMMLNLRNK